MRLKKDEPLYIRRLKLIVLAPFWLTLAPFFIFWEYRDDYYQLVKDIRKAWGGEWA